MSAYSDAVLALNPLLYWRLNETSGSTASDASGNGNHGTYQSGITLGADSLIANEPDGGSVHAVRGDSESAVAASVPALGESWTIAGWFEVSGGLSRTLLEMAGGYTVRTSVGYISVYGPGINPALDAAAAGVAVDTPLFIVITRLSGEVAPRVYLNGSELTDTARFGDFGALGAGDLWLGGSGSLAVQFNGRVDEFALFNTALTAGQIANLHTIGNTIPSTSEARLRGYSFDAAVQGSDRDMMAASRQYALDYAAASSDEERQAVQRAWYSNRWGSRGLHPVDHG